MRKLGATLAALPVLVLVYLATLVGNRFGRVAALAGAAVVAAVVLFASLPPAPSTAIPAYVQPAPVDARLLDTVTTGHALTQPLAIAFDSSMEPSSVAAAVRIQPDAAVELAWDPTGRILTIKPVHHWQPSTLYAVTVAAGARATDGGTLAKALRSVVLTAAAGTARLEATAASDGHARTDTAVRIRLDRAVPAAAVQAALRTEPHLEGIVTSAGGPGEFLFAPSAHLAANTSYTIGLDQLLDTDGVPFAAAPSLTVTTVAAPAVVRFRPRVGESGIDRMAAISVRFSQPMNHATTERAFHAQVGATAIKGKAAWAEGGTVLVLTPSTILPYGAKVSLTVDTGATSRAGTPIEAAARGSFIVQPKPKPKPKPKPAPAVKAPAKAAPATKPKPKPIVKSGGGGAAAGTWAAVESYYLRLMNCTRTGGWVTGSGDCSSPGGRAVAPLILSAGITTKVSRPYAKLLATHNECSHFIGGNPGDRLRRAGYTSYRWGENLGCRSGGAYASVLGSHRFFQDEKPTNGGHYRNLMDARYKQVGIGVWVAGGRVRLVIDLYAN